MEKTLTPTRADRLLRVFRRLATDIRDAGMSRQLIEDTEFRGDSIVIGGQQLANFGLCSYLGLGDDPRVKAAARNAVDRYGMSYSSSVAYTAVPLYGDLRERLATIFDAAVVVAPTTTLGHLSALPVLIRPTDKVMVDTQVHSSVMMATQVLQANGIPVTPTAHNDLEAMESAIQREDAESTRLWFLTDGVFSMAGDTAPAEGLYALLEKYPNLHVYCDDAHGFGWDGEFGRGQFLRRVGWHERLVVMVGLAKSFGSVGGVLATTDEEMAEMIELCGPPLTFGGPIPPPSLAAAVASADIHLSDELPELQKALVERIRLVNHLAGEMNLAFLSTEETPLWYLDVGDVARMTALLVAMRDSGYYLNAAGFPVVPYGHAGLRFTVTLDNSPAQIEAMLTALRDHSRQIRRETEIEVDLTGVEAESLSILE